MLQLRAWSDVVLNVGRLVCYSCRTDSHFAATLFSFRVFAYVEVAVAVSCMGFPDERSICPDSEFSPNVLVGLLSNKHTNLMPEESWR